MGFCLLIKREVLDRIGAWDERFGLGNFEDDDYCRRALDSGYKAVIAQDAFIHHFGHVTFHGERIDLRQQLLANQRLFEQKWNPVSQADPPPSSVPAIARRATGRMISLCMIVRDNETTIEAAILSAKPWVDEIIVVDTGSKGQTPEICRRLGAVVRSE